MTELEKMMGHAGQYDIINNQVWLCVKNAVPFPSVKIGQRDSMALARVNGSPSLLHNRDTRTEEGCQIKQ